MCEAARLHGHGYRFGPVALGREIRGAANANVVKKEVVDTRTEKCFDRFPRRIHNGLALDVKAGV